MSKPIAHLIAEAIQLFLFTDDDFPDNQSSLEFHFESLHIFSRFKAKNPSECHCVLVKPISIISTQIRLLPFK